MAHRLSRSLLIAMALLFAAVAPAPVSAFDKMAEMRASVESSMDVAGTIAIDAQGEVAGYQIKNAEVYPQGVLDLVARTVPKWRFEPTVEDGHAVPVEADMRLLVVAHRTSADAYEVGVHSASFSRDRPGLVVSSAERHLPLYPKALIRAKVPGTVFLLLRVDRTGKVADAFVEQINLGVLGRPREMEAIRNAFERATTEAAKSWTFTPPTRGPAADDAEWSVRIPITYTIGTEAPKPGTWRTYVPGPRHTAPWLQHDELADSGVEALAPGSVYQVGQGLRLLTPLGAG
jgi:hypothetical protein